MGSGYSCEAYEERKKNVHVVIVGGGYGGIHCAAHLQKSGIKFTLIDEKDYFHHNVGALRAVVFPDYIKKTGIDLASTFGESFVVGKVSKINLEDKEVILENDEALKYTHLVMAVGSTGPYPGRAKAKRKGLMEDDYRNLSSQLREASDIVIIGGGATGVELAGEIRDETSYDDKSVSLIHSGPALLNYDFGEKIQVNAKAQLEDKNVKLFLGERVSNLEYLTTSETVGGQTVKMESGKSIPADLIFVCIGLKANSELTNGVFGEQLDEFNRLKVSNTLEVDGLDNVFAIGDCCNFPQTKMAAHAGDHGELVAENIKRVLQGCQPKEYKPRFAGMVITIGKDGGVGSFNGWNLPGFAVKAAKGKTLFTEKYWTLLGQEEPT